MVHQKSVYFITQGCAQSSDEAPPRASQQEAVQQAKWVSPTYEGPPRLTRRVGLNPHFRTKISYRFLLGSGTRESIPSDA